MGTSLVIDRKTGQRRVVLAYEILFSFFGNGIVRSAVMTYIIQSLTTCTLIIKQVLPKYSDSYIFIWHSKFANCLTWPKVDVLPYLVNQEYSFCLVPWLWILLETLVTAFKKGIIECPKGHIQYATVYFWITFHYGLTKMNLSHHGTKHPTRPLQIWDNDPAELVELIFRLFNSFSPTSYCFAGLLFLQC